MMKQKAFSVLENLDQLSNLNICYIAYVDTLYWYLFQIIMCLNPDFNCCNNFALFWVDKFTNRTLSFVLVIANLATWSAATFDDTTNFLDQVSLS